MRLDQRAGREDPPAGHRRIVGQTHIGQVHGVARRIVDFDPVRPGSVGFGERGVIGQHFVELEAGQHGAVGDNDGAEAQAHVDVARRTARRLVQLDGQHIIAGQQQALRPGDADFRERGGLGADGRVGGRVHRALGHVEPIHLLIIEINHHPVVHQVGEEQAAGEGAAAEGNMGAEVESDDARALGSGQGQDGVGQAAHQGIVGVVVAKYPLAYRPRRIVVTDTAPRAAQVAARAVIRPKVVHRQQRHDNRRRGRERAGVGRARRRNREGGLVQGAVGAAPAGDARPLRAISDPIDLRSIRREQSDLTLLEGQPEIHMAGRVAAAIGDEGDEASAGDETKRRDAVLPRHANGEVRQIQAAQRDGQRLGIVELDEVLRERIEPGGEPLIDLQIALAAEGLGGVGRAEGGLGELPLAAAEPADRKVGQLQAKGDRVEPCAAVGKAVEEVNPFAVLRQAEAEVEPRGAIRIIRVNDQVGPRG